MKQTRNNQGFTFIIIVVLALLVAGIGIAWRGGLLDRFLGKKQVTPEEEQAYLPPSEALFDVEEFIKVLKDKIVQEDWLKIEDYSKVTLGQYEGKYRGFDWLNDKNEIELIKGFWISYDPEDFSIGDTPPDKDIIDGVKKINSYLLEKGLVLNERNKWFQSATEEEFWKTGVRGYTAYEKGNIKCYLGTETNFTEGGFSVGCGDISKSETPPEYRAIYYEANPERDLACWVKIDNVVDNFAIGSSGCPFGAGEIWKEEDGEWQELFATQDVWSCKALLDNKVPPSLLTDTVQECIFYECYECEGNTCGDLKDECERQKTEAPFIYSQLYEEKFGKER